MKLLAMIYILAQANVVSLPESMLTAQQRAYLITTTTAQRVSDISGYVGMGREIGIAVNDALLAITERANDFASTDVGKLTVALVVYKVIGTDVLQFFVGMLLLFILTTFCYFVYRAKIKRREIVDKIEYHENGKVKSKTLRNIDPDERGDWAGPIIGIYLVGLLLILLVIFV